MTWANLITLVRIGLVPVFAVLAKAYDRSAAAGRPREDLRRWAASAFLLAATTDGLDGYVARRFNQRSRLGTVLDPLADKGLMVAALTTVGLSGASPPYPSCFPTIVLGRDGLLAVGYAVLRRFRGRVTVKPSRAGKTATVFQICSILGVLLRWPQSCVRCLAHAASVFTLISAVHYVRAGIQQALRPGASPERPGTEPGERPGA